MTDNQYYEIAETYWRDDVSTPIKKKYCTHRGKHGEYCVATTHKSCKNCRFFVPGFGGKVVILVQNIIDRDNKIKSLMIERDSLKMEIKDYKYFVKKIKNYMEKKESYSSIGKSIIRNRKKRKKK